LHNFDQVLTYNRFEYLKVERKSVATEPELQAAWLSIISEFIILSKNVRAMGNIKKRSNLVLLERRLTVLVAIEINIKCGNDVSKECAERRIKSENIRQHIGLLKNEISRMQASLPKPSDDMAQEAKPVIESDIDKSIAYAAKHGYKINRFETVVSEWCQIMNMIESSKPQT
jgi:hypothetical protein